MKYIIHKFYTIGSFEKEEKWINEMAGKGMMLTDVGFCRYVFEDGIPGEYTYRLELLNNLPSNVKSIEYIKFLEETGVEYVSSIIRWVYFRKKTEEGSFVLYSDIDSKIKHYKRITLIANSFSAIYIVLSLSYFWQAWTQYCVYLERNNNSEGFFHSTYQTTNIKFGISYLAMIILFQCVVIPVRTSIYLLKQRKKISE